MSLILGNRSFSSVGRFFPTLKIRTRGNKRESMGKQSRAGGGDVVRKLLLSNAVNGKGGRGKKEEKRGRSEGKAKVVQKGK